MFTIDAFTGLFKHFLGRTEEGGYMASLTADQIQIQPGFKAMDSLRSCTL